MDLKACLKLEATCNCARDPLHFIRYKTISCKFLLKMEVRNEGKKNVARDSAFVAFS